MRVPSSIHGSVRSLTARADRAFGRLHRLDRLAEQALVGAHRVVLGALHAADLAGDGAVALLAGPDPDRGVDQQRACRDVHRGPPMMSVMGKEQPLRPRLGTLFAALFDSAAASGSAVAARSLWF
jgi:hypothetical protein